MSQLSRPPATTIVWTAFGPNQLVPQPGDVVAEWWEGPHVGEGKLLARLVVQDDGTLHMEYVASSEGKK